MDIYDEQALELLPHNSHYTGGCSRVCPAHYRSAVAAKLREQAEKSAAAIDMLVAEYECGSLVGDNLGRWMKWLSAKFETKNTGGRQENGDGQRPY